jgi:mRNA-degrading endonuclease RelE of RelBE toxin-antitoxin system
VAKKITWTDLAKADVRAIDSQTAMHILRGLARFLETGEADVKRLQDVDPPQFRLRVGAYRVRFYDHGEIIEILRVQHRSEAYR